MIKYSNITFRITKEQKEQLERIAKEDKGCYLMQKVVQAFLEGQKDINEIRIG